MRHLLFILPYLGLSALVYGGTFAVETHPTHLVITSGGKPVATYIHKDPKIYRPYFAHLYAPDGTQVSRRHPPREPEDATDHATMHPGVWMAFAELNQSDFWRNRAVVEHVVFIQPPVVQPDMLVFTVANRYLGPAQTVVAVETNSFTLTQLANAYLLTWDSTIVAGTNGLRFGDQEEMGLGARVSTPLTPKAGGRMVNHLGDVNEAGTRGKITEFLDCAGPVSGRRVGLGLLAHPANPLPSYAHSRDYGLMVLNPFGRGALTGVAHKDYDLPAHKSIRLRFGVLLYQAASDETSPVAAAYDLFKQQ